MNNATEFDIKDMYIIVHRDIKNNNKDLFS